MDIDRQTIRLVLTGLPGSPLVISPWSKRTHQSWCRCGQCPPFTSGFFRVDAQGQRIDRDEREDPGGAFFPWCGTQGPSRRAR